MWYFCISSFFSLKKINIEIPLIRKEITLAKCFCFLSWLWYTSLLTFSAILPHPFYSHKMGKKGVLDICTFLYPSHEIKCTVCQIRLFVLFYRSMLLLVNRTRQLEHNKEQSKQKTVSLFGNTVLIPVYAQIFSCRFAAVSPILYYCSAFPAASHSAWVPLCRSGCFST